VHIAALARINDQLCFYLFADAELQPTLAAASAKNTTEFTPQAFPSNPYSVRIHVTMSDLAAFRSAQLTQTLGMSFAFAVEQLLLYVERAILHWAEINGLTIKITDPIEDCLAGFYQATVGQPLLPPLLKTIKYLRLRRNHYIHLAKEPSAEFKKLLKYDAPGLQAHWLSRTSISGLEFASDAVVSFTPDESITLIKIMRICIEDLDGCIAPHIDSISIVANLYTQLLQLRPELRPDIPKNFERHVRKIRKRAKELHGMSATTEEIANALGIAL
jgi:hypothetical protein